MTPEQQQIAIGEAHGWTWHGDASWPKQPSNCYWKKGRLNYQILPNYPFDLNAMHEVEETLTQDQMIDYSRHVGKSVTSHLPASRAAWMDFHLINATATQRAEAFLRTIGKWEEAK